MEHDPGHFDGLRILISTIPSLCFKQLAISNHLSAKSFRLIVHASCTIVRFGSLLRVWRAAKLDA